MVCWQQELRSALSACVLSLLMLPLPHDTTGPLKLCWQSLAATRRYMALLETTPADPDRSLSQVTSDGLTFTVTRDALQVQLYSAPATMLVCRINHTPFLQHAQPRAHGLKHGSSAADLHSCTHCSVVFSEQER